MLTLNDGRKELYQWDTGRTATVDIECDVVHFANLKYGESLAVEVKAGVVSIPNKLLMSGESIYCWAFAKDENGAYTKKEQTLAVTKRAKPSDYLYTETEVISVKNAVNQGLEEAKENGDFKGDKGDTGATGPAGKDGANGKDGVDGKDGTSVTVSNVSESTEDGGNNVVTFSDGKTLTVKNGSKGSQGEAGATGATGETGKSAYASAQDGGFTGTESQFNNGLSVMGNVSGIDNTVTQNSGNLITSGAVYSYIQSLDANEVKY